MSCVMNQALRLGNAAQDAAVEVVSQQPAAEDQVAPRLQNVFVPVAREFALLPGSHVGAPSQPFPWGSLPVGQLMVPAAASSAPVVAALQGGVGGVVEPPAAAPPNLTGRKRSRSEDQ